MSQTAEEIAILSLEEIGEYSPVDQSVDPEYLRRTLQRLHSAIALLGATNKLLFDVKTNVRIPLEADKQDYDYGTDVTAGDLPDTGIQFIHAAYLRDNTTGSVERLTILFLQEFDELEPPDRSNWPEACTVLPNASTIRFWPIPGVTGAKTVHLEVQEFSQNLASLENANSRIELSDAWAAWCRYQTAYDISGGVVRKLPKTERDDLRENAELWKNRLLAFQNRMQGTEPIADYNKFV